MPPREKTITNSIMSLAKDRGIWVMKIHGGPFQKSGIPDCLFIKNGEARFIEVKRPGEKPSVLQQVRMKEIREIGGAVAEWVDNLDAAARILWP